MKKVITVETSSLTDGTKQVPDEGFDESAHEPTKILDEVIKTSIEDAKTRRALAKQAITIQQLEALSRAMRRFVKEEPVKHEEGFMESCFDGQNVNDVFSAGFDDGYRSCRDKVAGIIRDILGDESGA